MMRLLVYASLSGKSWSREIFPDLSPAELPVAGKPWALHAADLASCLGIKDMAIADAIFSPDLAERLGNGSYWSMKLEYFESADQSFSKILNAEREKLAPDEDLLILFGGVLPDVPDPKSIFDVKREVSRPADELPAGLYLLRGGKMYECIVPLFRMTGVKDYFDSNFKMMNSRGFYNLPGYGTADGAFVGANVIMMPSSDVAPPAIIMDNCYLGAQVVVRNGAIFGRCVAVDMNTEIDHSIIFDNTYIGRHMMFRNKIVRAYRVIDPYSGNWIDLEDPSMAGVLRIGASEFVFRAGEWLIALLCAVFEFPLWLLVLALTGLRPQPPLIPFLRRVYPKLWKVVFGKCHLVRENSRDAEYAFRYSDLWYPAYRNAREQEVNDTYFYYHRSLLNVLATVIIGQVKRAMSITDPWGSPPDRRR